MTQPQAQQVDHAANERVEAARDMLRDATLGTVFAISFREQSPALWMLVKNDRFEFAILNMESGNLVTNKISLFAEMVGRRQDGLWLRVWE